MASLRIRTNKAGVTTYAVLYRDPPGASGRQSSQTFVSAKAANDFRALVDILGPSKALAELDSISANGITVDELAERFFEHKAGDVTPRTLGDYRRDYANWIRPQLGHRQADAIDEEDVQALVDSMKKRLDPKSVRDRHVLLSSMYRWGSARTRRLVEHNPCGETELPKMKRKPVKGMTIPEWQAFYATARKADPDVADMALFLVATGWRWSEAAALSWAHVADVDGVMFATVGRVVRRRPGEVGAIVEDAKNSTSLRASRIGGLAADMLRRRQVGQPVDGLVFTNPRGGQWHQSNFLERHWAPIAEAVFCPEAADLRKQLAKTKPGTPEHSTIRAQLEAAHANGRHPTPHWLRHTHAMLLDRGGATTPEMARRLGHADIQTTVNVYGGLIGDVSPEVLDRVDAMLLPRETAGDVVVGELVSRSDAP